MRIGLIMEKCASSAFRFFFNHNNFKNMCDFFFILFYSDVGPQKYFYHGSCGHIKDSPVP